MKPIVVGVDGSKTSFTATNWAAHVAAATGAPLHVVSAFVPTKSELWPERVQRKREDLERQLRACCEPNVERLGVSAVVEVVDGDPRRVLCDAVHRVDAGLLVVGSVGMTGAAPGWLRLGSVVEYLAHHIDVPLVVVPPSAEPTIEKVVVGVDGSPNAALAALWAARLVHATGARATAVAVARQLFAGWEVIPERKLREDWAASLNHAGDDFDCQVVQHPDPARGLLEAAREARADTIVVGMRGLGGFVGLRAGGVALKVLHRADRTVVLVPPC